MRAALPFAVLAATVAAPALAATTCNGYADLCSRLYSNVTFIGTHDSYAVGTSVADNQDKNVTAQLTRLTCQNDGVRTLQVQAHSTSSGIHLCHTSCDLVDGGSFESYLTSVASWISSNPNDVVTLVIVNSDNLSPSNYTSDFDSAGLSSKVYSPSSASLALGDWPSLGTLIDAGTTLVVFMDYDADFSSVPYIIDEFSNMWEDAYDVTQQDFGCAVNRTSGTASSQLMLANHFLDTTYSLAGTQFWVPDKALLNETNAASGTGSIGAHVANCVQIWGRNPNHILLDFYDSNGNTPFDLVATMNGVAQPTNTVTPGAVGSTAGGASATGSASGSGNTAVISSSALSAAGRAAGASPWGAAALAAAGVLGVAMGAAAV